MIVANTIRSRGLLVAIIVSLGSFATVVASQETTSYYMVFILEVHSFSRRAIDSFDKFANHPGSFSGLKQERH